MIANYLGEPALITMGYAFEQATNARRTPDLETTMQESQSLGNQSPSPESSQTAASKPAYITDLETFYGAPSQAAFGSAVFYALPTNGADLTAAALDRYKYFVGEQWERYGAEAWMGPWKEVYVRTSAATPDIVAELRAIADADAALSVPMILDNIDDAENARAALAAAYDDPAVNEVRVFNLGDSAAMSGLLVAGRRATSEAIFLVFLLD
ncbi:MAG TPA: hypothetical protein P5121_29630 [Caldilineaceae bacterium]|nr:hypothetical protein [Caldilineaceae bacterium]